MGRSSSELSVLSLYTGAGRLHRGLGAPGFEPVLSVEVDEDARATLKHNRPNRKLSEPGDIHRLTPNELLKLSGLKPRQLTPLAGGPPCQPFSKSAYWSNGHGSRLEDPRSATLSASPRAETDRAGE
jgi:DNA (cytosine-5)-methyltransferase 1